MNYKKLGIWIVVQALVFYILSKFDGDSEQFKPFAATLLILGSSISFSSKD